VVGSRYLRVCSLDLWLGAGGSPPCPSPSVSVPRGFAPCGVATDAEGEGQGDSAGKKNLVSPVDYLRAHCGSLGRRADRAFWETPFESTLNDRDPSQSLPPSGFNERGSWRSEAHLIDRAA